MRGAFGILTTGALAAAVLGCGQGDSVAAPGGPSYGGRGAAPEGDGNAPLSPPESSFTLPVVAGTEGLPPGIYYPDLSEAFPEVDFTTLDRLYVPGGEYRSVLLGGLPERDASRPLVITNIGGQVRVGGHAQGYVFVVRGGSGWILTGRHDASAQTGDAGYRGHAEGAFANSQGTYGFWIDDAFSREGLSGLAVGGGATAFELEFLEVTRAEFAGIVVKTDDDGSATMRDVKLHDLYVHDVGSEGLYLGSTQAQPQHAFERLEIYDNRFLRTGTEALQVGQLGAGAEIHHNVLGPAALRWRSAFQRYQDGNVQYGQRYGSGSFHHNIVIGTGDLFVELFPTRVDGDPRSPDDAVSFADNYFSDTSSGGAYTHADATGAMIEFTRNSWRGFSFNYGEVYPGSSEPVQVFGVGADTRSPHLLTDNVVDAPYPFLRWASPLVTESNNRSEAVSAVEFESFMTDEIEANYRLLEWWTERATSSPGAPSVRYAAGAFVMHGGQLYRATADNESSPPDQHPELWQRQPTPADDVRLSPRSSHAGLGLRF